MGKIGARKNSIFKAVSTAPSFNKTPLGSSTPPIPYPTVQDLSNSVDVAMTVRFNGNPAYVLNMTQQPGCKGDDAGTAKGVKSGTVNGFVKPTKGAPHFKAEKHPVVRHGDPNVMNGGNNPGIYVTTQSVHPKENATAAAENAEHSPLIQGETDAEKSFLARLPPPPIPTPETFLVTGKLLSLTVGAVTDNSISSPLMTFVPGQKG
ncbi:DUF4150 domain-containing protein [Massilia sp. DJPM01]|uniref:DUF4150 domain-containing protein n=1 Tax=Massilia sp. DJPM01 TaxID=3024404 RepID=UPI00259EA07B|nr:DUF4150 domain-containing protein [Massilia sp. DJPM01]MDM5182113.1 DUF4150 domain-containing protein [Massilia sp. DJPM01]